MTSRTNSVRLSFGYRRTDSGAGLSFYCSKICLLERVTQIEVELSQYAYNLIKQHCSKPMIKFYCRDVELMINGKMNKKTKKLVFKTNGELDFKGNCLNVELYCRFDEDVPTDLDRRYCQSAKFNFYQ